MHNIFHGNRLIGSVIEEVLLGAEIKIPEAGIYADNNYPFFTESFYFNAYFYLSKRFGHAKFPYDEHKEAGAWNIPCKSGKKHEFLISVRINSCFVEFIIYGEKNHKFQGYCPYPYWIAKERAIRNGKNINPSDYEKYGEYNNSYRRTALKVLRKFLKSCLTETISVRDCHFNIMGRCKIND